MLFYNPSVDFSYTVGIIFLTETAIQTILFSHLQICHDPVGGHDLVLVWVTNSSLYYVVGEIFNNIRFRFCHRDFQFLSITVLPFCADDIPNHRQIYAHAKCNICIATLYEFISNVSPTNVINFHHVNKRSSTFYILRVFN